MNKQEKIRRKNEAKKAKRKKMQQRKNVNINTINYGSMQMLNWDNTKTVLRIIGYDAFQHFGLTCEEADFMTSFGNWICFADANNCDSKIGNRYAADGECIAKSDEEFVLATAHDVLPVVQGSHSEKLTKYSCLFMKMLDADYAMADRLFKLRGMDTGKWLNSELHRIHNVFVKLGMVG